MRELSDADRNWRRFVLFRVLFNSRFYYPVLAVLFLDLGLSATQYTLLNFAWALAIVFTDLPAGVLADRIGRRPLVVAAAACMVVEMALLCLAPRHGGVVLLLCCLGNRVLSGVAEGMASGADEALVFDSLAERGRLEEWPRVLDQVMRWQGAGLVIAMLIGGAVYDPRFMSAVVSALGWHVQFDQGTTLRFPLVLNLVTAAMTLAVALGLREPGRPRRDDAEPESALRDAERTAWRHVTDAATWIARTPVALFVICGGVLMDSVTRLFLTFSSSYLRIIHLPPATYGLVGASFGLIGFGVAPMARQMVVRYSVARNYALVALVVLLGLAGAALKWSYFGVIFIVPLTAAIMAVGYMVSYYLNALAETSQRATVLSFKGVAFNLGYGFISLLFALVLRAGGSGGQTQNAVALALDYLPVWIVGSVVICLLAFGRQSAHLARKI
jgi:MFS family permease